MRYKVEVGSALYKRGIRWTEYMESEIIGKHDFQYMVLDFILTISMVILMILNRTTTMLILVIMSQTLGHANFNKGARQENNMVLISMNEVKISPVYSFPNVQISDFHLQGGQWGS